MARQFMLTTIDNPFNPFEDYKSWLSFDKEKGYDSAERVMRIADIQEGMTDVEENKEIERAIDEIIKYDILNIYQKVGLDLVPVED